MTSPSTPPPPDPPAAIEPIAANDAAVRQIVSLGPAGAYAVAGIATALVIAVYFAFYVYAYLPRGVLQ